MQIITPKYKCLNSFAVTMICALSVLGFVHIRSFKIEPTVFRKSLIDVLYVDLNYNHPRKTMAHLPTILIESFHPAEPFEGCNG